MERGLNAQLSPNEETTLHRLRGDSAGQAALRPPDIRRLLALGLIEYDGEVFVLTKLGMQRLELGS